MNRNDKIIVAILAVLMVAWFWNARKANEAAAEAQRAAIAAQQAERKASDAAAAAEHSESAVSGMAETTISAPASTLKPLEDPGTPEVTETIETDLAVYTFTNKGGALQKVVLKKFQKSLTEKDAPVELSFTESPAFALQGFPGVSEKTDFTLEPFPGGIRMTAQLENFLTLTREVSCADDSYLLRVTDRVKNTLDREQVIPSYQMSLGAMTGATDEGASADLAAMVHFQDARGKPDTLEQSAVEGFTKGQHSFGELFGASGGGCSAPTLSFQAPLRNSEEFPLPGLRWIALRSRFFTAVFTPDPTTPGIGIETGATREPNLQNALLLDSIQGAVRLGEASVSAGGELQRSATLYVGPRQMSELRKMGSSYLDIMSFGSFGLFCRLLLDLLNFIHRFIPNYGWAIIILTLLVRMILHPLNKKSTESMRKMQEVQPLLKELQEKYKSDPKMLQAEQMRLYAEHKVNPLSGCLPMLLQLPIFIALFNVLRTCVELRFASFLWIADLSQPENLFRETLGFGVNLLPIAMAVTMTLQSRLTPSAGDARQQRMMMIMMPVMMLVMCYSFPSALGLYWSVSQALAILVLWYTRYKDNRKKKQDTPDVEVIPPPRATRQMKRHGN